MGSFCYFTLTFFFKGLFRKWPKERKSFRHRMVFTCSIFFALSCKQRAKDAVFSLFVLINRGLLLRWNMDIWIICPTTLSAGIENRWMNNLSYGTFHPKASLPSGSLHHISTFDMDPQTPTRSHCCSTYISHIIDDIDASVRLNMSACTHSGVTHYNVNVDLGHEY